MFLMDCIKKRKQNCGNNKSAVTASLPSRRCPKLPETNGGREQMTLTFLSGVLHLFFFFVTDFITFIFVGVLV